MLTMRRSGLRSQKNVAEVDENSPSLHPASIHCSMARTNTRFKSVPPGSSRDSSTVPCMLRTTYHRGSAADSSGSCAARLLAMDERYPHRPIEVHPVVRGAASCMHRSPCMPSGRRNKSVRFAPMRKYTDLAAAAALIATTLLFISYAVFCLKKKKMIEREITIFDDDVFLTSYPRSVNTWTRFLVGNFVNPNEPVTFLNVERLVPDMYKTADWVLRRRPRAR